MGFIKKTIAAGLMAATLAGPVMADDTEKESQEPEPKRIELGYNALQAGGTTDGQPRFRLYTNATANLGKNHVFLQGLNEAAPGYFFGWNTAGVGREGMPFDLIYTMRSVKDSGSIVKLDEALGARVDISSLPVMDYGHMDLMKNLGSGLEGYDGGEIALFAGKELGRSALEGLVQLGEHGRRYAEIEFLGPLSGEGLKVRPYARVEFPGMEDVTAIVGVQVER